jgi:hypothetical protein
VDELQQHENEPAIIIDGRLNLADYKIYWREKFARKLPNVFIFWGILALGTLFFAFLFREDGLGSWFLIFSGLFVLLPIFLSIYNYYGFINRTRKYIASLSETEKYFNIIIKPDGSGIEYRQGENSTFILWDSISGAVEKDRYFSLDHQTNPFLIMKNEFNEESDIAVFRDALAGKFGKKAKLLR